MIEGDGGRFPFPAVYPLAWAFPAGEMLNVIVGHEDRLTFAAAAGIKHQGKVLKGVESPQAPALK